MVRVLTTPEVYQQFQYERNIGQPQSIEQGTPQPSTSSRNTAQTLSTTSTTKDEENEPDAPGISSGHEQEHAESPALVSSQRLQLNSNTSSSSLKSSQLLPAVLSTAPEGSSYSDQDMPSATSSLYQSTRDQFHNTENSPINPDGMLAANISKKPLYLDSVPGRSCQNLEMDATTSQGADIGIDIETAENSFIPDMTVLLSRVEDTQEPLLVTSQHHNVYSRPDDSAENALGNKCESNENITEDCIDNPIDDVIDNNVTVETLPDLASLFVTPAVGAVMSPKEKGEMLDSEEILDRLHSINQVNLKSLIRRLVDENTILKAAIEENNRYLKYQMKELDILMSRNFPRAEKNKEKSSKENGGQTGTFDSGGTDGVGGGGEGQNGAGGGGGFEETALQLHNLSTQLDVAEQSQAQLSQDLQRVTSEKMELINRVSTLQMQLEERRLEGVDAISKLEHLEKDKWELSRVNQDLQQRLQQTVALAHMQAEGNESRLQEEVGKLLAQLEEEREVTARLSTSLELERRKLESLEQKSKGAGGKKDGSRRRSSLIPEEVRESEGRLMASMDLYRQRCENLGSRISGCQQQLERDTWQQPELSLEITKLRKLLAEEKRSCHMEAEKLREVHHLFEQVYQEYASALETIKQSHHEKKSKHQQLNNSVMENIKESNLRDNMDSLTARLMNTEDALNRERLKNEELQDRLRQSENQLEAIPILEAQVEVYRSDFNAEREARERIAGEKADLAEELAKFRKPTGGMSGSMPATRNNSMHSHQPRNHQPPPPQQHNQYQQQRQAQYNNHNNDHNNLDYHRNNGYDAGPRGRQGSINMGGGGGEGRRRDTSRGDGGRDVLRERINPFDDRGEDLMMAQIPLTVNQHNTTRNGGGGLMNEPPPDLNCPKCGREFRNTTLLTRHVNDCLDRDF